MSIKRLLFSVTKNDLVRQTFRCPGKGGQNVNKRDSGVRLIHPPSGAVGHSCTHREQARNAREAFLRLVETKEFRTWHRIECARRLGQHVPESPEAIQKRVDTQIEEGLKDGTIQIEYFEV